MPLTATALTCVKLAWANLPVVAALARVVMGSRNGASWGISPFSLARFFFAYCLTQRALMFLTESSNAKTDDADTGAPSMWLGRVGAGVENKLEQKTRALEKGTIVAFEGQEVHSVFLVRSGWIAVSKSLPDGERQIIEFILPGEIYDPVSADGITSFVTLEALSETQVVVVSATMWTRLLDDVPDLRHSEKRMDVGRKSRQSERILRLGKSSAETRIAYVLIELCMRMSAIGAVNKDGTFHIPLGQQQLSEFTGLSSVHVCRTLRRLNRQGLITTGDHMDIEIHDISVLADMAGVDLDTLRGAIIPGAA